VVPLFIAGLLYVHGVRTLARGGHPWLARRTVYFLSGLASIYVATQSALDRYSTALFSVHIVQHMVLTMVAPPLIALGAPVTLALRATGRTGRRRILRVVRSRPVE